MTAPTGWTEKNTMAEVRYLDKLRVTTSIPLCFYSLVTTSPFRELRADILRVGVWQSCLTPMCLLSSAPTWLTCPGTQEENKNRLLSEVLNGQVPLFSSHGTIHTLVAVAFTHGKKTETLTLFKHSVRNKTLSAQNQTLLLSLST